MVTAANATTAAVAAKRKRKTREVDTRPLLWPSVIVLFLWMKDRRRLPLKALELSG